MTSPAILRVVIADPLHGYYDYLASSELSQFEWRLGLRLRAPFGRSSRCAIFLETDEMSAFD